MSLGATLVADGCRFEVWAPLAHEVRLVLDGADREVSMEPGERGYWRAEVAGVRSGDRYWFRLDGERPLPDPASRHQPLGVHGPSAAVDPAGFEWSCDRWRGLPLQDCVYYELHVGTFTGGGTLDGVVGQLDRLAEVGITMIELMPVNAFPGRRNWGYDGVFPFAVQDSYGGPAALARLVDEAHRRGIGVTLDVVHNHIGPEGGVLHRFGPYFTDRYATPWGAALNFSEAGSDEVRRYFIESATQWVTDYRVDGLRLDAVHAIVDPTARPFLEELVSAVRDVAHSVDREVLVIAESADNDPRLVRAPDQGGIGCDAVWNDDFHHSLRVALTGETAGYYVDYQGASADLAQAYEHGFVLRGGHSEHRGRRHGRPATGVDPRRLVVFALNHDQVGNRPQGRRLVHHLDPSPRRLAAAAVLLSPFTPLLFMGEEYGDPAPFPFFVDHSDPELLEAVRRGRSEEFAGFAWDVDIPDPAAESTFASAVLRPELREEEGFHAELHQLYHRLLQLRRDRPALRGVAGWPAVTHDDGLITLRYGSGPAELVVLLNFSDRPRDLTTDAPNVLLRTDAADRSELAPWSAAVVEQAQTRTSTVADRGPSSSPSG